MRVSSNRADSGSVGLKKSVIADTSEVFADTYIRGPARRRNVAVYPSSCPCPVLINFPATKAEIKERAP